MNYFGDPAFGQITAPTGPSDTSIPSWETLYENNDKPAVVPGVMSVEDLTTSTITSVNDAMNYASSTATVNSTEIAELKQDVATLENTTTTEITELKQDVNVLDNTTSLNGIQITANGSDIAALQNDVQIASDEIDDLAIEVGDSQVNISALQDSLVVTQQDLANLNVTTQTLAARTVNQSAVTELTEFVGTLAGDTVVANDGLTVGNDGLTVGGVIQDTDSDVYGQISSGLGAFSMPLITGYRVLNAVNVPGLVLNTQLEGINQLNTVTYGFRILQSGVYQVTANAAMSPADDGATVHFTLFATIGGAATETDFQSVAGRMKDRFSNHSISAILTFNVNDVVYLGVKSPGADQTTTLQFISMNIVRLRTNA